MTDTEWDDLTEAERDAHCRARVRELKAERGRVHARLALIAGLLDLAGQMAAAFVREHGPGCDCPGCYHEPSDARELLLDGGQARWLRMHRSAADARDLLNGIVVTAGFQAEWTSSALKGVLPDALGLDGDTWQEDFEKLAALLDRSEADDGTEADAADACVAVGT